MRAMQPVKQEVDKLEKVRGVHMRSFTNMCPVLKNCGEM